VSTKSRQSQRNQIVRATLAHLGQLDRGHLVTLRPNLPFPESRHFTSGFRATLINLRRLSSLPLLSAIAFSACPLVISDSGQSWETRAGVIPSLLAISAHEATLPSLSSLAHVCTFRTTDQGSEARRIGECFARPLALVSPVRYFRFSKGIETRKILSPTPPWAAI